MKLYHPPSGLNRGLDFLVDAGWTPEQALAVVELLDDLRDRIWAHYQSVLLEQWREARAMPSEPEPAGHRSNEPPF